MHVAAVSHSRLWPLAVLKGIEDFKAKGFNPPAVHDEARRLADKHLKVSIHKPAFSNLNNIAVYYVTIPC